MDFLHAFRRSSALGFAAAALAVSTQAFAGQDFFYPSAATAGTGNSFTIGSNGDVNLGPVSPGSSVSFAVTWGIQDRRGGGGNTSYSRSVGFSSVAVSDPGVTPQLLGVSPSTCAVSSASSTCTTTISFTAPTPLSGTLNYRARVVAADQDTGGGQINGKAATINFSVTAVSSIATTTEAHGPYCALLNGSTDLRATLKSAGATPVGIGGKLIAFGLETAPGSDAIVDIGSAITAAPSGDANLNGVSLLGRGVGDYAVKAAFAGDSSYDASHDTATLGISYLFVGFQQPINPEGNSVFGSGRVIPVKIKLADALGNPVSTAMPRVWVSKLLESSVFGSETETTSVSAADTGNIMRYSPTDNQYIYNWDLSSLTNGTYKVRVDVGDSAACSKGPYEAIITVSKKKG